MIFIDADSLVYKAGWAVERRFYLLPSGERFDNKRDAVNVLESEGRGGELTQLTISSEVTGGESFANRCLDKLYEAILQPFEGRPFTSFISGSTNFRHKVAVTAPYKGNRKDTAKPKYYDFLRDTILRRWNGELVDGIEADDRMAIEGSAHPDCVLVGIDKDLLQIPGTHYNYDKGLSVVVSEEDGWRNFFTQVLVGDVSDNIPGVSGIGPKKAANILALVRDSIHDMYTTCYNVYLETYEELARERFDEVCGLLYLLRYENDNWADAREWLSRSC